MDGISLHKLGNDGDFAGGGALTERESDGNSGGAEGNLSASALGGNRWPQDETLALLNIRLEMDPAFRDAGIKAPLWDEVSRRLAQLGYNRSASKSKEKFENLYKYHKRTKYNRLARSNAKTYRFFDLLEALDHQEFSTEKPTATRTENAAPAIQSLIPNSSENLGLNFDLSSSSSSGDECEGSRKRKRKWQELFRGIMKIVLEKQEDLHKKFLEVLDRCECERIAREEAWKREEMARIKREQELLEHERFIAATKDAAVIAFLQKVSEKTLENPSGEEKSIGDEENGRLRDSFAFSGPSRWPKVEVDALIKIRTDMEIKYQGGDGPKGLWEEISGAMKKLGYDRNAKRCKEKWENINKYYRRVKENNKKRAIDSKTCSYFEQLEALYQIKSQKADNNSENSLRPEELLMHMMNHHHHREQEQQKHKGHLTPKEEGGQTRDNDDDDDDEDEDDDYAEADHQIGDNEISTRSILA